MQKHPLASKVALITGAARRVGAEIARVLHDAGMNIVLHYNISEKEALALCENLNQIREHSAIVLRANLDTALSGVALIQQTVQEWGRLDVVINNASKFYRTYYDKVTEYEWDDLINSNLKAPFFIAQAASLHLAAQQGCIVNITDIHGEKPMRDYSVYCLSKAGLLMLTKVLAKELGPHVRVNAVSPGVVLWPEGENALAEDEKQKLIEHTMLLREGTPRDIAKTVLFLIRDSDYITGQVINVDGGRLLHG